MSMLKGAKFPTGQIAATPYALDVLDKHEKSVGQYLTRHATGDWGDLGDEDRQANEDALLLGERIFSSYKLDDHDTLWIITERDRSLTTLLLPNDY